MRLPLAKRIELDGIPAEQAESFAMLARIMNPFMANTVDILNGGVNFDNFESRLSKITIKTDASGNLKTPIDINVGLGRFPLGHICVDVRDSVNTNTIPNITGTPYLIYTPLTDGLLRVSKVLNIGANANLTLTIWFL